MSASSVTRVHVHTIHRRRVPSETMERGEFQSLNGIEISSQLGRQRQSRPGRAGRRRLIPAAKVVPLYDRVYNTYTRRSTGCRGAEKKGKRWTSRRLSARTQIAQQLAGSTGFNLDDD